ncbi:hypothetical protein RIF29_33743 [Crotalaria pallida]|uniref:Uncharacterized protein n=1 Tax=Crotalaria pallida TaxID=3830 RepID=A0AAN9E8M3_CROPI
MFIIINASLFWLRKFNHHHRRPPLHPLQPPPSTALHLTHFNNHHRPSSYLHHHHRSQICILNSCFPIQLPGFSVHHGGWRWGCTMAKMVTEKVLMPSYFLNFTTALPFLSSHPQITPPI